MRLEFFLQGRLKIAQPCNGTPIISTRGMHGRPHAGAWQGPPRAEEWLRDEIHVFRSK